MLVSVLGTKTEQNQQNWLLAVVLAVSFSKRVSLTIVPKTKKQLISQTFQLPNSQKIYSKA